MGERFLLNVIICVIWCLSFVGWLASRIDCFEFMHCVNSVKLMPTISIELTGVRRWNTVSQCRYCITPGQHRVRVIMLVFRCQTAISKYSLLYVERKKIYKQLLCLKFVWWFSVVWNSIFVWKLTIVRRFKLLNFEWKICFQPLMRFATH